MFRRARETLVKQTQSPLESHHNMRIFVFFVVNTKELLHKQSSALVMEGNLF